MIRLTMRYRRELRSLWICCSHFPSSQATRTCGRRATFVLETLGDPRNPISHRLWPPARCRRHGVNGAVEVAIAGTPGEKSFAALEHEAAVHYVPSLVLAGGVGRGAGQIALLEGREMRGGKATAYVCRSYACDEPATSPQVFATQLEKAGRIATPNQ